MRVDVKSIQVCQDLIDEAASKRIPRMGNRGSYIGGHTVIRQSRADFEAELERKAVRARKKAIKAQLSSDKDREKQRAKQRAKIRNLDKLNRVMKQAAAVRRATTESMKPELIRRASQNFTVLKISRAKTTRDKV
jgi:hypothetical protein